ncbi:bifunctional 3-hydroxydecanoyl-ACP dehydratase/trans-2-decenoyl-ACP isomerase [Enterobacteriaceae endosymbiont of Plateumaris consimilis]|uniref:bifunctional 3-hydroxydecanoyl-ACP dehydratase/trans-2-decenoyl-ACP isomerase n=1 Tax=Enterobacteriaceae endosymbiont of Plateumaris consimilis TaxID=2675794 RepID=UPI001448BD3C|nr:bifunctional 3-hydroxydecanoyl-ACP dehydratase/trans-2-decenoyl-ACP isomerase [Enterobacteriaceae endosymbiont of Plateumaris consimilis]QJC28596.1 bifunctional 3-hydroxydecanoyl-ACP dehydratase/trans-2-decenoyl-ACP isomerase [Enterobacteriaceae endosymbiont of Plateumaris consimilis]
MMCKKNFFSKKELIIASYGKLFKYTNPKLSSNKMLLIDKIVKITKYGGKYNKGYIEANLYINPKIWFFSYHFIGDPIMPGCLGLDTMFQLIGFYLGWIGGNGKGRALGVKNVTFIGEILPTSRKVTYFIHLKRVININYLIGIANGVVSVDNKLVYKANNLKVGLL